MLTNKTIYTPTQYNFITPTFLEQNKDNIKKISGTDPEFVFKLSSDTYAFYGPQYYGVRTKSNVGIYDTLNGDLEKFGISFVKDKNVNGLLIEFKNGKKVLCQLIKNSELSLHTKIYEESQTVDPFNEHNNTNEILFNVAFHKNFMLIPDELPSEDYTIMLHSKFKSHEDNFYIHSLASYQNNFFKMDISTKKFSDEQLMLIYMYYLFYNMDDIDLILELKHEKISKSEYTIAFKNVEYFKKNLNFKMNKILKHINIFNVNIVDIENTIEYLKNKMDKVVNFIDGLIIRNMKNILNICLTRH